VWQGGNSNRRLRFLQNSDKTGDIPLFGVVFTRKLALLFAKESLFLDYVKQESEN
jgi:hypothetical protein